MARVFAAVPGRMLEIEGVGHDGSIGARTRGLAAVCDRLGGAVAVWDGA